MTVSQAASAGAPVLRPLMVVAVPAAVGLHFYLGAQPWAGEIFLPPWDKLAHASLYFTLTIGMCLAYPRQPRTTVFMLAALLGLADEAAQSLQPYRRADALDWLADVAAACGACLLAHVIAARQTPLPAAPVADANRPPISVAPALQQGGGDNHSA